MVQQESKDCLIIYIWIRTSFYKSNQVYHGTEVHAQDVGRSAPALMLDDNISDVLNTAAPSNVLKKKHLVIGYHRVREAVVAKISRFAHIKSEKPSEYFDQGAIQSSLSYTTQANSF